MATVIDALYVTLGLQAKGFKDGVAGVMKDLDRTRQGARKTAVDMEASGKVAAEFFSRLRREALGLLAVFTAGAGIKAFTENTILGAAGLNRLSANLNISAKDLAAWQLAAKNAGGTAHGITQQLKESATSVANFKAGFGADSGLQFFFRMGGTTQDLKDGNTYLMARARIVNDLFRVDPTRAVTVAQSMGINEESLNLIRQGPEAIDRLRAAQSELAGELARAAGPSERLRQRFDALENRFTSIGVRILGELMPAFDRLLDLASRFADWVNAHRQDIADWVESSVKAVREFVLWADRAAQAVGGWQNVLLAFGAIKLAGMVAPLLSIAGALASIASSLGLIGGAAGVAGVAALGAVGAVAGTAALTLYSRNLNQGEEAQLQALNTPATNREQQIAAVKWFESRGYSREHAIGIVSNLQAESGLNPNAVGDGGNAYGVAQWHPDRQANFKRQFGIDIRQASVQQQFEFIDWELRNTEAQARRRLLGTQTPQAAAEAVSRYYERPKDADGDARKRAAMAGALYRDIFMAENNGNAVGVVTAAGSGRAVPTVNTTNSTTTTETHFNGPITIQTQATDGTAIFGDLMSQAKDMTLATQANTGLR